MNNKEVVYFEDIDFDVKVVEFIKENCEDGEVVEVEFIKQLESDYREDGGELEMCDKLDELYNLLMKKKE